MGFFYDDESRDKLTTLYFLDRLNIELTRDQISRFAVGHDLVQYFDLQSTVCDLEESGFLAVIPRAFGQAYAITPEGREVLNMFYERIPTSRRDDMDTYADACREKLREEQQYSGKLQKRIAGGYVVSLKNLDRNGTQMSIDILLPDSATANLAINRWPEVAGDIYRFLIEKLCIPSAPAENGDNSGNASET